MNVSGKLIRIYDRVESFGNGSIFQHGKENNRVYLIKLLKEDFPSVLGYVNKLARDHHYTKIVCKVPYWAVPAFISDGFLVEAHIPAFHHEEEDLFFVSKFLSSDRLLDVENDRLIQLTDILSRPVTNHSSGPDHMPGISLNQLSPGDASDIADLYKSVFRSHPFPVFEPDWIRESMKRQMHFFGVQLKGRLLALGSFQTDPESGTAELKDFATLTEFRGNKLSHLLLNETENFLVQEGISTFFCITRISSLAMTRTFLKMGYHYSGTLIKNTKISGRIESMNVFYKHMNHERNEPGI